MFQVFKFLLRKLYQFLWFSVYYLYLLQSEVISILYYTLRLFFQNLLSCWPPYSQTADVANLAAITKTFAKLPKHLAISVVENESEILLSLSKILGWVKSKFLVQNPSKIKTETDNHNSEIDLRSLAKLVSWAWASNIPQISLYDYNGQLKVRHKELGFYIQEEILQHFWSLKELYEYSDPPTVKFHNVTKLNGYSNGVNGKHSPPALNITLFSCDDGKDAIVRVVKEITTEKIDDSLQMEIDTEPARRLRCLYSLPFDRKVNYESKIDSLLNSVQYWPKSGITTDPDLLIILGNIKSTLGFLPWHIRLTEMHWLPTLYRIQIRDFQDALWKFARCQQRFGT